MYIDKNLYFKESLPFLKTYQKKKKTLLYNASRIEEYKRGELISSKYSSCTGLVIVISGQLRSFMSSLSGKEITLLNYLKMICVYCHHLVFIKT